MSLRDLHRNFINEAMSPMFSSKSGMPIQPKNDDSGPIIAVEKWRIIDDKMLVKKYMFRNLEQRNAFIRFLLIYEEDVQHNAGMLIDEDSVTITLKTHDVDKVTELDKEYAAFADSNFKDVVYNHRCDGR